MPFQTIQLIRCISCPVCFKLFDEKEQRPISLACGHTVCKSCIKTRLKDNKCPFDQKTQPSEVDKLPSNFAVMQMVGAAVPEQEREASCEASDNPRFFEQARSCVEDMAIYLKPLAEEASDDEGFSSPEDDDSSTTGSITSDRNYSNSSINVKDETSGNKNDNIQNTCKTATENTKSRKKNDKRKDADANDSLSRHQRHHHHQQQQQQQKCILSRPMQRKLISLIHCQLLEEEGRSRSARIVRSLGERIVSELLVLRQFPHQLSSNLWAAVRTRGCQFLGPAMQEEVLKLILLALEDGSPLSRKVLVLFVVQKLEMRYPQASKTAIGHVVQLLYRASCFKVQKRDGESSLMQLKEEFRQYEVLRREHDAQIVQIALEAGLRISPEQWSSLLYGDVAHKPHMQSIIDKHQTPQSFSQNISELMVTLQKNPDGSHLQRLQPQLEFLSNIDPSPDCPAPSWENLVAVMRSLSTVMSAFVDYLTQHNTDPSGGGGVAGGGGPVSALDPSLAQNMRYKTSMCRDFSSKRSCPRGSTCTFAHTQEELEKYRLRSRKTGMGRGRLPSHEKTTSSLTQLENDELRQVQLMSGLKDMPPQPREAKQSLRMFAPPSDAAFTAGTDAAKFYPSSPVPSVPKDCAPAEQKMLPADGHTLPCGIGRVQGSSAEAERRPHLNMPTTRLTFSRPALDGQEPSNAAVPHNQQASLHPNILHTQAFVPRHGVHNVMSSGPPQQPHISSMPPPTPTGQQVMVNPALDHTTGLAPHHHHHHQQQQQHHQQYQASSGGPTPVPIVAQSAPGNSMFSPAGDGRMHQASPPDLDSGSAYEDAGQVEGSQAPNGMTEQITQQQRQQWIQAGMMSAPPIMPHGLQKEECSLQDLWLRKHNLIKHLHDDPTFLGWEDPTLYQADSRKAGFHGLDTVLSLNKRTQGAMPKPVSDTFVATRSTQSLDKLVTEEPAPMLPQTFDSEDMQHLTTSSSAGMQQLLSQQQQQQHQQQQHEAPSTSTSIAWENMYHQQHLPSSLSPSMSVSDVPAPASSKQWSLPQSTHNAFSNVADVSHKIESSSSVNSSSYHNNSTVAGNDLNSFLRFNAVSLSMLSNCSPMRRNQSQITSGNPSVVSSAANFQSSVSNGYSQSWPQYATQPASACIDPGFVPSSFGAASLSTPISNQQHTLYKTCTGTGSDVSLPTNLHAVGVSMPIGYPPSNTQATSSDLSMQSSYTPSNSSFNAVGMSMSSRYVPLNTNQHHTLAKVPTAISSDVGLHTSYHGRTMPMPSGFSPSNSNQCDTLSKAHTATSSEASSSSNFNAERSVAASSYLPPDTRQPHPHHGKPTTAGSDPSPLPTSLDAVSYSCTSSQNYMLGEQRTYYNSLSSSSEVVPITSSAADVEFSSFPADDSDESCIPFEQTSVSKFGPISRRNKTNLEFNAPVQVTADLSKHTLGASSVVYGHGCDQESLGSQQAPSGCVVATTTAVSQPQPVEKLGAQPAVKPTALENRSIWEQSPLPSYQNIAQLMAGAASAVSNNEKLAYQLQAVELEISMKTGRKPEPVGKMIQASLGAAGREHKGMMEVLGTGHVTDCLRNMHLVNDAKTTERFADFQDASK